ncbi:peptidase inhibitor family I36 protein [Streptosporangium subroseum]|uniref:peptidase inhibitor family I36 protein n=1 Tax=Streptosporangium subroseum TaxID=106412 RepID=UPI003092E06E|nr:peptidase inhibitor family I36 protein [Streptosporangium subroseum]
MKRKFRSALAAAAVLLAVVGLAPAAQADSAPGCDPGAFCVYSGWNQTGYLLLETQSNWNGTFIHGVHSVFNNGNPCRKCDHVDLTIFVPYVGNYTKCIHYNPGPGEYKVSFDQPIEIRGVVWRGEC